MVPWIGDFKWNIHICFQQVIEIFFKIQEFCLSFYVLHKGQANDLLSRKINFLIFSSIVFLLKLDSNFSIDTGT